MNSKDLENLILGRTDGNYDLAIKNQRTIKEFETWYYNNRFALENINYDKEKSFEYFISAVHANEDSYRGQNER